MPVQIAAFWRILIRPPGDACRVDRGLDSPTACPRHLAGDYRAADPVRPRGPLTDLAASELADSLLRTNEGRGWATHHL